MRYTWMYLNFQIKSRCWFLDRFQTIWDLFEQHLCWSHSHNALRLAKEILKNRLCSFLETQLYIFPKLLISFDSGTILSWGSLTCEEVAFRRSVAGIRQLASPRKHTRMWSTSAQRPTVNIRTINAPRRTATEIRSAWFAGRSCCPSVSGICNFDAAW